MPFTVLQCVNKDIINKWFNFNHALHFTNIEYIYIKAH